MCVQRNEPMSDDKGLLPRYRVSELNHAAAATRLMKILALSR